jgi:hypothetical protein
MFLAWSDSLAKDLVLLKHPPKTNRYIGTRSCSSRTMAEGCNEHERDLDRLCARLKVEQSTAPTCHRAWEFLSNSGAMVQLPTMTMVQANILQSETMCRCLPRLYHVRKLYLDDIWNRNACIRFINAVRQNGSLQ